MSSNRSTPDPIDVSVGKRVRGRRRDLGITQTQLANALGVTFQQVQKYERGTNRFSASTLVRTAQRLMTTVGALVGETEHPSTISHTVDDQAQNADEIEEPSRKAA